MMDRILWLGQAFGISSNKLADFFRVAPSSIQKAAQGKRKNDAICNDPSHWIP